VRWEQALTAGCFAHQLSMQGIALMCAHQMPFLGKDATSDDGDADSHASVSGVCFVAG
jgi:hypothetical protein